MWKFEPVHFFPILKEQIKKINWNWARGCADLWVICVFVWPPPVAFSFSMSLAEGKKHPTGFVSCDCSALTRSHMRKLSLLQMQQKKKKEKEKKKTRISVSHHNTQWHNTNIIAFLSYKKVFIVLMTLNEGIAVCLKPQNRLLVVFSSRVSGSFIINKLHTT